MQSTTRRAERETAFLVGFFESPGVFESPEDSSEGDSSADSSSASGAASPPSNEPPSKKPPSASSTTPSALTSRPLSAVRSWTTPPRASKFSRIVATRTAGFTPALSTSRVTIGGVSEP